MLGTVLVVDDSEDILELVALMLKRKGYEVSTAMNGREGLDALAGDFIPDVILLDVELPDMRGTEFLDQVEKNFPLVMKDSAIIFYTAGEFPQDNRVRNYLKKMSDISDTVGIVSALAANRHSASPLFGPS